MQIATTENTTQPEGRGSFIYTAEASTLGLAPGDWPPSIPTTLGNGLQFDRYQYDRQDGELVGVRYRQQRGHITLFVLND